MAKYVVQYSSVEYYEKVYEANSEDEAIQAYYDDDKLFESSPYDLEGDILKVFRMATYEIMTSNPDDRDHAFIEADSATAAYDEYLNQMPLTVLAASKLDDSGEAHITYDDGIGGTEDATIYVQEVVT